MVENLLEIEIKTLLGSKENAEALKIAMKAFDPSVALVGTNKQLNHYFVGGDVVKLEESFSGLLSGEGLERFRKIMHEGQNISLRTRKADEVVLFVVKASIDDTTSANGTARIEFESKMAMTLDDLDGKLLASGCAYQAKWSRDREEYAFSDGTHICIDRNAGYGYLAEFERVVSDATSVEMVKKDLRVLMEKLGVVELPQDRLERMFAHYNENWREYYGTEKTFTVE